jgi:hypothetical protein
MKILVTIIVAIILASDNIASFTSESFVTITNSIVANSLIVTLRRTFYLRAINAKKSSCTFTLTINTSTISIAIILTFL